LHFTGNSLIADPHGKVLIEASSDKEEIHYVDIDPQKALDKQITPVNELWKDRREDIYRLEEIS